MSGIIDHDRIIRQLYGYNPWWTGRQVSVPEFKRIAFAKCKDLVLDTESRRAVMLSGPRRVGKSTVLLQLAMDLCQSAPDPRSVLYLSLDDSFLKLVTLGEILSIYRQEIWPEGERAFVLLDEVHYSPDWDLAVKNLVDHHPEYKILATGSASVEHRQRLADTGVGRWYTVPIPTLSFYEFVQIRGESSQDIPTDLRIKDLHGLSRERKIALAATARVLMPSFNRYLLVGGFPETASMNDVGMCQRLLREDVIDRVLKRDLTALWGVRNVQDVERLFIYLCLHSGAQLNVQQCASDLGTNRNTLSNHLELLVQANLVYRVEPDRIDGKKALKARHKYYLVDAALRNAILLSGEEVLQDPNQLGTIVETVVLRHMYAFYYQDTPRILYWRDPRSEKEVDIIVKSPRYTIPVEVKYRSRVSIGPNDGLFEYCQASGINFAIVVTRREEDFDAMTMHDAGSRCLLVPAHIFTYLIGQSEQFMRP